MRIFSFKGHMKKALFIALFIVGATSISQGQIYFDEEEDSVSFKDRVYFGGNFSFNVGNRFTYIDVSPLAGYQVSQDFSVGLGITYLYLSREFVTFGGGNNFKVQNSVYGGRAFLRHAVLDNYFAHAEFETLNTEFPAFDGRQGTVREWVPGLFIGGGTFQPIFAGGGGVNLTVLFNLLHDELKSPYNSALVIRGGFTF